MKAKRVEVKWVDAQSSLCIHSIDELKDIEIEVTSSLGYLLYECEEHIILGFMLFGDDSVKHLQLIPKGMIKSTKEVRL